MTFTMRRAADRDLPAVLGLLAERAEWLRAQAIQQGSTRTLDEPTRQAVDAGLVWVMTNGEGVDVPIGTVTLSTVADLDFWGETERATPALYVSKLATARRHAGRGIGAGMMAWANNHAADLGISHLRWDVWKTNEGLQAWYQSIGYEPARVIDRPGRFSWVLYDVAYRAPVEQPDVVTDPASMGRVKVARLSSTEKGHPNLGEPSPDGDDAPHPDHWHTVPGLLVPNLGTQAAGKPAPLTVAADSPGRTLLYDSGDGWRIRQHFPHRIASWMRQPSLISGQVYELAHIPRNGERCGVGVYGANLAAADRSEPALAR